MTTDDLGSLKHLREYVPCGPCHKPDTRWDDWMTVEPFPQVNERKPRPPMFVNLAQPVAHRTRGGRGIVGRLKAGSR